jgi:hypothetical protein
MNSQLFSSEHPTEVPLGTTKSRKILTIFCRTSTRAKLSLGKFAVKGR